MAYKSFGIILALCTLPVLAGAEVRVAPVGKVLAVAYVQRSRPTTNVVDSTWVQPAGRSVVVEKKPRRRIKRRRVRDHIAALKRRSPKRHLDRELRRQYRQYQRNIRSCYLRAARRTGTKITKTDVDMTITAVGNVSVVGFTPALPPSLSGCLEMWLHRWKFSPDTHQAQVSFPVMFRPGTAI